MQINDTLKNILRSLAWRSKSYTNFWFSKYEFEKFWLTERTLRTIIEQMQKLWYIEKVGQEKFMKDWIYMRRNLYKAHTKLFDMVASFTEAIKDMNDKIVSWCKEQNPVQTLKNFWIEVFSGGRIGKKKSSLTINKKNGAIKDWKTWKSYNLYNYLRESINCTHSYFVTNLIW